MQDFENLCKKCMNDKGTSEKCPFCGYVDEQDRTLKAEPERVVLQDKYVRGDKISENAESICYVGYDTKNRSRIHIREFFPSDICERSEDGITVKIKDSCKERYEKLKEDFLEYFRDIAKVRDIEAVISVYDIFSENGTAYIISEIIDGISLYSLVKKNGKPLDWDTAKILFMPALSAFSKLSKAGILHLGINPKSLIIGKDGKMHISGFSTSNARQVGVFTKCEFSEGFTAPEQYMSGNVLNEGTDIYGFTASLFFALVGFAPKDASKRDIDDRLLIPVKTLKNIPPHVVSAMANGLNVNIQKRTSTFEMLRDELTETSAKYLKEQGTFLDEQEQQEQKQGSNLNSLWIICPCVILVLVLLGALFFWQSPPQESNVQTDSSSEMLNDSTSENIVVPNFVGKNFEELRKIEGENDNYTLLLSQRVFDDNVQEGDVISQVPQAGQSIKKGANIVVTVSRGPQFRILPPITGTSLADASMLLTKAGFVPVKEDEYSSEIDIGYVIGYKDHNPGDRLEFGSEIKLLVSKGTKK